MCLLDLNYAFDKTWSFCLKQNFFQKSLCDISISKRKGEEKDGFLEVIQELRTEWG